MNFDNVQLIILMRLIQMRCWNIQDPKLRLRELCVLFTCVTSYIPDPKLCCENCGKQFWHSRIHQTQFCAVIYLFFVHCIHMHYKIPDPQLQGICGPLARRRLLPRHRRPGRVLRPPPVRKSEEIAMRRPSRAHTGDREPRQGTSAETGFGEMSSSAVSS